MSKFTKTIAGFAGSVALIASLAGSAGAVTFSTNLTVGSRGDDVTALQTWLIGNGYSIPAGATGYFGSQTRAAVAAYQTAKGISPTAGYFGPITRAAVNAGGAVSGNFPAGCTSAAGYSTVTGMACYALPSSGPCTGGAMYNSATGQICSGTVPGCAVGAMYSSTTGQLCSGGSTTVGTGITTLGVEGTITVTESSAGINSTVYEGDLMTPILGIQVEAKNSDVSVQRVKLDLGTTTKIYNKIYRKIYITDGSTVLASYDLNSSTVVKDGTRYYITLAGFNALVKKDTKKVLTVKVDVYGSIDSADRGAGDSTLSWGVRLHTDGVRAIDGAGIDQYAGTTAIGKSITVSAELAETATLNISTNTATPAAADVVAALGSSENEADRVALLGVDVRAEKDNVTLNDIAFDIDKGGTGGATASTTAYLYDGSTEIDNVTVSSAANGGFANFTDVDLVVAKNTTKTLWLKIDIRNANGTASTFAANASSSGTIAENTKGDSATVSGSATGETAHVRNVGPVFTLVSKTISKSATPEQSNIATSTAQATFTVKIKAVGSAITFGGVASNSPMVGSSTPFMVTYYNGAATTLLVASTTAYDIPGSGVDTSGLDNSFTLPENNEITMPITFTFEGRTIPGVQVSTGAYSVALERIRWRSTATGDNQTTTFMAGETDWRTSTVTLP